MEEGSFRCDANVSVRRVGATAFGTKVEIKNMNSFRNVERAIIYEIARQARAVAAGERLVQETRLWDADREETRPMRSKEEAHDYRYFPEPDLLPLVVEQTWVDEVRAAMPELPGRAARALRARATASPPTTPTCSRSARTSPTSSRPASRRARRPRRWPTGSPPRSCALVREEKLDDALVIRDWPITPAQLAALSRLVEQGTINRNTAKWLLPRLLRTDADPAGLVATEGLAQVSDRGALERAVDDVLERHPDQVAQFRRGKEQVLGFLVGQVMKSTGGKANPALVQEVLRAALAPKS